MSKHTPGPWIAVGSWVEVESDDIPDICTCDPNHMGQASLHRSDEEVVANARLIAAAPEMLAMLHIIFPYLIDLEDYDGGFRDLEIYNLIKQTKSVIQLADADGVDDGVAELPS